MNPVSRGIIRKLALTILCLAVLGSCRLPAGLEPAMGIEGSVSIRGVWPDSLKGLVVAALDSLDLNDPAGHLIDYSPVVPAGADSLAFFIQLFPGTFYLVPVGITMDPAFFITNLDSITQSGNLPLVPLVDPLNPFETIRLAGLSEGSVKTVATIIIDFSE